MKKYIDIILNATSDLFKSVDEKDREERHDEMTEEEKALCEATGYFAEWGLHPMLNPEYMTWDELMEEAQKWAREERGLS